MESEPTFSENSICFVRLSFDGREVTLLRIITGCGVSALRMNVPDGQISHGQTNWNQEPSLTVNVEGRGATAEEAADWVEYANGSSISKYGALRASNGHPEPYRVRYWEIGNEIWGDWVRGHSDAKAYA